MSDQKKIILSTEEIENADVSEKKRTIELDNLEKELHGTIVEHDGKVGIVKEVTTSQFCGDDIKKTIIERQADKNTIYLGKEVENDFNAKTYIWGLIEGKRGEQIGFKDWLYYFQQMIACEKDPILQNRAIAKFFEGTNFNTEMKQFFIKHSKDSSLTNIDDGIRIWMHLSLKTIRERKELLKGDRAINQIDDRTYNNMLDLIEKCEEAVVKFQAGEITL